VLPPTGAASGAPLRGVRQVSRCHRSVAAYWKVLGRDLESRGRDTTLRMSTAPGTGASAAVRCWRATGAHSSRELLERTNVSGT
jgi:hypothetical protein